MAIDRRIVRTRAAIYDALVALIRERDYEGIRVEDILRRANVGRSTFYAHFKSRDDVLARSLERLGAELIGAIDAVAEPDIGTVSRALFAHVDRHRDIQAALAGSAAGEIVHRAIAANFAQAMQRLPLAPGSSIPRELAAAYASSTLLCVMRWWFDRNHRISWEDADRLFRSLVSAGLAGPGPT